MIQQAFSFEADQGYRFVVEDIQIKMRLLTCSMHYEPIRVQRESVAFGAKSLEELAKILLSWTVQDGGIIALHQGGRLQVITNSVVVTGKVLSEQGEIIVGSKIEELFISPFLTGGRSSVHLFRSAYQAHQKMAKSLNLKLPEQTSLSPSRRR